MMSDAGGANVAVMEYVPRPGAPPLAVVLPSASTRPALSVMRHESAASKTDASPLIVAGDVMRSFASGWRTTIEPFTDTSAVGDGRALAVPTVAGAVLDARVGVALAEVTRPPPHAESRASVNMSARTRIALTLARLAGDLRSGGARA